MHAETSFDCTSVHISLTLFMTCFSNVYSCSFIKTRVCVFFHWRKISKFVWRSLKWFNYNLKTLCLVYNTFSLTHFYLRWYRIWVKKISYRNIAHPLFQYKRCCIIFVEIYRNWLDEHYMYVLVLFKDLFEYDCKGKVSIYVCVIGI